MGKKSVFISYSSKDAEIIKKIIEVLESENISYWKAPEMIPIGSNYAKEIPRVISECDVFLLVISDSSQKSIWVEKEIDYAINNRKTIVPFKITDGPLSDIFRFYLNNVQAIFYNENKEKGIKLLRDRIVALIKGDNPEEMDASKNISKVDEEIENDKTTNYVTQKNKGLGIKTAVRTNDESKEFFDKTKVFSDPNYGRKSCSERNNILKNNFSSSGSFGYNPQPIECKYCGGKLKFISKGIYECMDCKKENYDYFQTVRNYLAIAGPSSRMAIEKATGIPRESIDYFIRQERLEIPMGNFSRLSCRKCGAAIRTGELCDRCKKL